VERPVKLRNVVGLLRGSDPALQDSYVLVTAHYDHVGIDPSREIDPIFNGANDDGSGTVSVIELASAMSRLNPKPKRSLVFMTVFAEEKGLLGSRYYARHPLFPLAKTVASINLEVLGRTDGPEGSHKNKAGLTGFDYSNLGDVFVKAGQLSGVDVYRHPTFSDAYYPRSDNLALAEKGVVAHSVCAGFVFPDLHSPQDHWDKIDYPNLARLNRLVAIALWMIAENPVAPAWNAAAPKAAPFLKALQDRHP
jgi:Zn-dependent M28 family amino/carboxypeptidase